MGVKEAWKALRGGKSTARQAPRSMHGEIGYTGNLIFSGLPMDEYNPDLAFPKSVEIYDQMRRSDGQIAAVLNAMKLPIRSAKWYVEPDNQAKDEKLAEQIADFVEFNLFEGMRYSWDDHLREALLMLEFGFSVFEKVYRFDTYEGKPVIMLDKYAPRVAHSVWRFPQEEQTGEIIAVQQLNYYTGELYDIPLDKVRMYTYQREGDNPIGISALRAPYKHWYYKERLLSISAVGTEKSLIGTPYAQVPKGTSDEDKRAVLDVLTAIRAAEDAGFTIPVDVIVGMLEGKSDVSKAMPLIEYHDTQIARAMLAQFINLGTMSSASGGSYALGNTMVGMFVMGLEAIASYIAGEVQKDVDQLVEWNFGKDAPKPRLKHGNISIDSTAEKLTAIAAVGAGHLLNPDEELENTIRGLIGVPPISKQALDNQLVLPANRYEPEIVPDGKLTPKMIKDAQAAQAQAKAPGAVPGAQPVAAKKTTTQMSDGESGMTFADNSQQNQRRQPTKYEQNVDVNGLEKYWLAAEGALLFELQHQMQKVGTALYNHMSDILKGLTPQAAMKKLSSLKVSDVKPYEDAMQAQMIRVAEHGAETVAQELGGKGAEAKALPREVTTMLEAKAKTLASVQTGKLLNAAQMAAIQTFERGGTVEQAVTAAKDAGDKYIGGNDLRLSANVTVGESLNIGRGAEAKKKGVQGAQWSAILDDKTCPLCAELDGQVISVDNPDFDIFRPPLHFHCRCFLTYILADEQDVEFDWKTPAPSLVKHYGGFVTMGDHKH